MHACLCHRPAWLYQRLWPSAPLNKLCLEAFPSDGQFWLTWAACPQLLNIVILRKHFTEHTWLNWTYTVEQSGNLISMALRPRRHVRAIPAKAAYLLFAWATRWLGHKMFREQFLMFLISIGGYLGIVTGFASLLAKFGESDVAAFLELVRERKLSYNPMNWEHQIDAKLAAKELKED